MALIRALEVISKKWQQVTPQRSGIYKDNVESPLRDWEKETLAASDRRDQGLRDAIADGRIDRGIKAVGLEGWRKPTVTKGPARWSEGVALAEPEFRAGFAPYHDVIQRTDPGPRFAKGDPRNWERSKRIGLALHERKVKGA
ncbi:hypothetical protein LCGC14_1987590 [marine sediment metagenome]|uniref:Uncharacterized protein n=1 Tax=marine sediment metagenome TaxID=412755 RepID=A0A0F9F6X4_9ZZZZ